MVRLAVGALAALVVTSAPSTAQQTQITKDMAKASLTIKGQHITIERTQDPTTDPRLHAARTCPPNCITPMIAAKGVATVGELEVIDFLKTDVASGKGLLLDTRSPDGFAQGSIPGALNVPTETLGAENPYRDEILRALGGRKTGESWQFASATNLLMFADGPWSDQSARAIRELIAAGYPANKIRYYRGGLLAWETLGLTTTDKK